MRKLNLKLLVTTTVVITAVSQAEEVDLHQLLRQLISNNTNYYAPTTTELETASALFCEMLSITNLTSELESAWGTLGFQLQTVQYGGQSYWLVTEPVTNQAGRGFYLFRPTTPSNWPLAIQAPHPKDDLYTGYIALHLFTNSSAHALAVATVTRTLADMAHMDGTYFQSFTTSFAYVCPTGRVIQIHGFAPSNYPELDADVVLSAATNKPPNWLTNYAYALSNITGFIVAAYPYDTSVLGGTRNAQAAALRQFPNARFIHTEIARLAREMLYTNALIRQLMTEWFSFVSHQ